MAKQLTSAEWKKQFLERVKKDRESETFKRYERMLDCMRHGDYEAIINNDGYPIQKKWYQFWK